MKLSRYLMIPLFLVIGSNCGLSQEAPKDARLNDSTYEIWRDHVLPRSWELNFQKIAWRTSFWEGIIEAQEKDMPILLWTMNGHPLCNT